MGQYYLTVNIDKRQFIDPHNFGDGLKLLELCSGQYGVLMALGLLLADGNGRGGGDLSDTVLVDGKYPHGNSYGKKVDKTPPDHLRVEWEATYGNDDYAKSKGQKPYTLQGRVPKIVGSWAGDRIVVAGDYADKGKYGFDSDKVFKRVERRLPEGFSGQVKDSDYQDVEVEYVEKDCTLYDLCRIGEFEDISLQVLAAAYQDRWILENALEACEEKWRNNNSGYVSFDYDNELIAALQLNPEALKYANEWANKKGVQLPEAIRLKTRKKSEPSTPEIDPAFAD